MLFGEFEHTLDDKGRLMIPSKIRSELQDATTLYVLKGFEGCMSVYTKEHFDKLISSLEQFSYFDQNVRAFIRMTLSSVVQLNLDKVGRIQFTPATLEKYHISKTVMVIGVNDHLEIWDKKAYVEYEKANTSKFEEIANSLVKVNG